MKSKDQQLLEEAYTLINESATETFVKKIIAMPGGAAYDPKGLNRDKVKLVKYLAGLLITLEKEVPGVKEYIKQATKTVE